MQINVRFLDNLKLEASFDDFKVITDQPIRYKGDGTAPSPYDYFLASSALCAAYFVRVYCNSRNIPTTDIVVTQNNIVDPNNRYNQEFHLQIELPASIDEKDREGILAAMDRCTVKRVIQNDPKFIIEPKNVLGKDSAHFLDFLKENATPTYILSKDAPLEVTLKQMTKVIEDLGINLEITSWRNPVPHVWSVHIRDADSPLCFTNGKGASKEAALCSALGEYIERLSSNYFYNDYYLGKKIAESEFVHYPDEKWFKPGPKDILPEGLMDDYLLEIYNPEEELKASHLIDTNSGNSERGICALPFIRQSDEEVVYIPANLIGNLFVSNGMSAGNSKYEARVQALSEIFERAVKNQIIKDEITLPDVPNTILSKYPTILEGIEKLKAQGFPVLVKDASLGGRFPVMCVTLMNPKNGGVFASFGSHPKFEVALERSLTELLQGRSFEGLNDLMPPTFNQFKVQEHNNIIDHFIDSTGVVSWKFFSEAPDYEFVPWDLAGSTLEEYAYLMEILNQMEKEVYIADYTFLGSHGCRILVPDYSEIYEIDDLIWDNNNKCLAFRDDILNIHRLSDKDLKRLLKKFESLELDDYMRVGELIGIAFEETTVWGQLTVGELKGLIYLALQDLQSAKEHVEMFLTFNDNLAYRKSFYQLVNILLDIELEGHQRKDYHRSLISMYGAELFNVASSTVDGTIRFYGMTETDSNLANLEKHQKLILSYKKLQLAKIKKSQKLIL